MNASRIWKHSLLLLILLFSLSSAHLFGDETLKTTVRQKVNDWQPTADERLLDQIGWAKNLVEARRLAGEHQRPLFVFTYSGSETRENAIALRRC